MNNKKLAHEGNFTKGWILVSQDEVPNDRKIGKLCEYASKNPLRIPKVIFYLSTAFNVSKRVLGRV